MIRPSALPMARKCLHASQLAEQFPESSKWSEEGRSIHAEIAKAIATGIHPPDMSEDAKNAVIWFNSFFEDSVIALSEHPVEIDDYVAGVVTKGTADIVVPRIDLDVVYVGDWKRGRADVDEPDDNLQLLTYGTAAAIEFGVENFIPFIFKTADGIPLIGRRHGAREHLAEIITLATATDEERRVPSPGDHCGGCYQRLYCHAYQARTSSALAMIDTTGTEMTADALSALSVRIEAVEDALKIAKDIRKNEIRRGIHCVVNGKRLVFQMRKGRESVDKEKLEADGLLEKYTKQGAPYEHPTWIKYKENK